VGGQKAKEVCERDMGAIKSDRREDRKNEHV
jgi:hypothetical protein